MGIESKEHRYEGADAVVTWDASVCMNSAVGLRMLPAVFDRNAGPWVRPDAAGAEALVAAISRCPNGALRLHRTSAAVAPAPAPADW